MIENVGKKDKKIAFMGTEDYHQALRMEAVRRKTNVQALLERALKDFLEAGSGPAKMQSLSAGELEMVQALISLLRSENFAERDTVKRILSVQPSKLPVNPDEDKSEKAAQPSRGNRRRAG